MKTLAFLLLCTATVTSSSLAASNEAMRMLWLAEAQRLEDMQSEYQEASEALNKALDGLQSARAAVDTALADPAVGSERLRELEDKLTDARDNALHEAENSASVREDIYDQIEMLEKLGAQAEGGGGGGEGLVPDAGVAGMWRAEWDTSGDFGLVKLAANGNLVTGTFRLTNGNAGSLSGTYAGEELRLDVINASKGFTGTVLARMDSGGQEIEGTWMRSDVGGGQRAVGNLTLTRLEQDAASELLQELR